MVTKEFQDAISEKKFLLAKIMLKDSLIIDTSFRQFNEMLAYARQSCPQIIDDFEGDPLEPDQTKWNENLMNSELVILVNNFSLERISHLKKVIVKVLRADSSSLSKSTSFSEASTTMPKTSGTGRNNASNINSASSTSGLEVQRNLRLHNRREAYRRLAYYGKIIETVLQETRDRENMWIPSNVYEMEQAAYKILDAVKLYKNNKEK